MTLSTKTNRSPIAAIRAVLMGIAAIGVALVPATALSTPPSGAYLAENRPGTLVVFDGSSVQLLDLATSARTAVSLPTAVNRVVALASDRRGRLYVASRTSGLWLSDDGGGTWSPRSGDWPGHRVAAVAPHATEPDTVYAYIAGDGIYRSRDAGRAWKLVDGGPDEVSGPLLHTDMADSMETGWVFAGTGRGVARSMDCFCLWRDTGALEGRVAALTYSPRQPATVYAVAGIDIWRSPDGGERWERLPNPGFAASALAATLAGRLYLLDADGVVYEHDERDGRWTSVSTR